MQVEPGDPASETRAHHLLPILLLAALALVAWVPSAVRAGFAFDDREAVEHNPAVESELPWTSAFERDYWEHRGAAGHFRPLATLALRVDRALWREHGSGFHATNVLLHVLVVIAASVLARRLAARGSSWPWIGLALFAVHPALADSVAWISGRSSMLAALPGLCAAIFVARDGTRDARGFAVLAALGALGSFLASLGKEDGLLWALALPLVAARRGRGEALATALGCLAGVAAMLALRDHALGSALIRAPHAPLAAAALGERLLVGGRALVEALRIVAWPAHYAPSSSGDPAFTAAALRASPALGVLGLAAWLVAFAVATVSFVRKPGVLGASAALAVLAWLPFLQLVPAGEVFAPRFLYLPLLFAVPLLHAGCVRAFGRRAPFVAALVLFALVGAAWSRGRVYSSRGTFREAVLALRPSDVPSWNDLGIFYEESGNIELARKAWRRATELDPHYSRAWSNLGRVELSAGHAENALPLLERAVREGPRNAIAHVNLGAARLSLGDVAGAAAAYREALSLAPGLAAARTGLARALHEAPAETPLGR